MAYNEHVQPTIDLEDSALEIELELMETATDAPSAPHAAAGSDGS